MKKPFKNSNAILLTGGKSRRMKKDKKFLKTEKGILIDGVISQIERLFNDIYISVSKTSDFVFPGYKIIRDLFPDKGPLMGILSALAESDKKTNFVIAADIPEINKDFISELHSYTGDYDIVVPVSGKDKYEPLFAFYNRSVINEIKSMIDSGTNKIVPLFFRCRTKFVKMEKNNWYRNLNTPEDYLGYLQSLKID